MNEDAMLLKHPTVTKVDQGFRIAFWCHSGTKQFLDRLIGVDVEKNCVELTVYTFSRLVLDVVHRQKGIKVTTTGISYMMDLSPCPDCEDRLTILQNNLKPPSFNTAIFSKPGFVLDYQQFSTLSK